LPQSNCNPTKQEAEIRSIVQSDETVETFLKMATPVPGWGKQIGQPGPDTPAMSPAEQEAILRKIETEKSELRERQNVEHASLVKAHWKVGEYYRAKGNLKIKLESCEEKMSYWISEETNLLEVMRGLENQYQYLRDLTEKVKRGERP
jgi:hypothetical protein